jgi:hypothetical protein
MHLQDFSSPETEKLVVGLKPVLLEVRGPAYHAAGPILSGALPTPSPPSGGGEESNEHVLRRALESSVVGPSSRRGTRDKEPSEAQKAGREGNLHLGNLACQA